jgi:hypothetical protein
MLGDSLPNQYGLGFSVHTAEQGDRWSFEASEDGTDQHQDKYPAKITSRRR